MEKLVRIMGQRPLQTRQWNTQQGEVRILKSVEVKMSDGTDTFVAEATDQLAEQLNADPLSLSVLYSVQCRLEVREWISQHSQQQQWSNGVRLLKISPVQTNQ